MKRHYLLMTMVFVLISSNLYAFDDTITHPELTNYAVANVVDRLNNYFKSNLNLPKGVDTILSDGPENEKPVRRWLMHGARTEDSPMCRASNHFHNPRNDLSWSDSGMTDQLWFVTKWCSQSDYPPETITSAVDWATRYLGPAPDAEKRTEAANQLDWDGSREMFHIFLTGRNYRGNVVAETQRFREAYFSFSLGALGQELHLLQDMAVPSHVRNDFRSHLQHVGITLSTLIHPTQWFSERFELYVKEHGEMFGGGSGGDLENKTITNFWDTNNYTGENPEITTQSRQIGLSEYTNANFASEDTIFAERFLYDDNPTNNKYYHPYPRQASTNLQHYLDGVLQPEIIIGEDDVPDINFYIAKTGEGEKIAHFVKPTYFSKPLIISEGNSLNVFYRSFMLDEACFQEYASLLVPKAIGYSGALLEYFFRGKIDVDKFIGSRDSAGNITGVTLRVKNASTLGDNAEPMSGGSIALVYHYLDPDRNQDVSELVEDIYSVNGANAPINTDYVSTEDVFFTTPIPQAAKGLTFTLVYKGTLGNEKDSIAAKVFEPPSKIAYTFQPGGPGSPSQTYAICSDGKGETAITNGNDGYTWHWGPSWSSDGTMLALTAGKQGSVYDIVVVDLTSQQAYPNNRKLTLHSSSPYLWPSFSPYGTKIVAQRWADGGSLVIFDVATGAWDYINDQNFWQDQRYPEDPQWSPEGNQIVYVLAKDVGQSTYHCVIMSIRPDGSANVQLTDDTHDSMTPAWSPDGQQIVYISRPVGGTTMDLWTMNKEGHYRWPLIQCPVDCVDPSFSPNGQQIVFGYGYSGDELYTIYRDGSSLEQLTTSGYLKVEPSWSRGLYDGSCNPK
jgi:hypothetical protein